MQLGDQGADVRRMQLALERAGYELVQYGSDGDFGRETLAGLQWLAAARGLQWDGSGQVPAELLAQLDMSEDAPALPLFDFDPGPVSFLDLRSQARNPHPKAKVGRDGNALERDPKTVDAIVLHQTATLFDPPKSNRTPDGRHRRALDVACHAMAFTTGTLVAAAPLTRHVYHADMLNSRSLGLEVEGNYPGLRGRPVATGVRTMLIEQTIEAARAGIRWLVSEGRRLGMPIRYIYAHRQTDSWRRADPGEGLWRAVVIEYAVPKLELIVEPARTWSHRKGPRRYGKPIPRQWDQRAGVGKY